MRREDVRTLLADPSLRSALEAMIRRRVPAAEVEDIVQAAFTEALASQTAPEEPDALRRWIFGVARNKVVDFHRRNKRETSAEDAPEPTADVVPHSDRDLLRWAENELPPGKDAPKTLEWMLREGAGEKLEAIAASEKIPAPTVRQRVHRLRQWMKKRWAAELALVAAASLAVLLVMWWGRRPKPIEHEPLVPTPREMAQKMRDRGIERCDAGDWKPCLDMLDRAAVSDPEGDKDPRVQAARDKANKVIAPAPIAPSAVPSSSAAPSAVPSPSTTAPAPTVVPTNPPVFDKKPAPKTMQKSFDPDQLKKQELENKLDQKSNPPTTKPSSL
jgi:RNA polymerase sigma-70 factor (ECF subfamily)